MQHTNGLQIIASGKKLMTFKLPDFDTSRLRLICHLAPFHDYLQIILKNIRTQEEVKTILFKIKEADNLKLDIHIEQAIFSLS
jgi:hypothetical protein